MKKKIFSALTAVLAGVLLLAGCGSKSVTPNEADSKEGTTITMVNSKIEVVNQLKDLAEAYKKETGVTVNIINVGPSVDPQATIKGLYLSDRMPDLIVCESSSFAGWEGLLVDMSDQEWTKRTDSAYTDSTYGTMGFPFTTEAIGLAYNAEVLKKAGIDPATLTSPSAYKNAFKTLDSKKKELGLTAVVGFCTEPEGLGWSSGNHVFGAYLDSGLARSNTKYIDLLNDGGKLDEERFAAFADFVGLLNNYSDPALLTSGTYTDQVRNFASGKYAFVTQGSWIGALLTGEYAADYKAAGSFKVGMAPYAFIDGQDTILTSPPSWWAVPKEGNVKEAEAYLQWCSTSAGQQILVEEAGFASPFSDCKYTADDPFAATIASYIAAGKTSNWHWMNTKQGLGQNAVCYVFADYAAGKTDAAGFLKAMKAKLADYYKD